MAPGMIAHLEGRATEKVQIGKVKVGRNASCSCGSGKNNKTVMENDTEDKIEVKI